MTNLLTIEEQKNVVGEYHRRLVWCYGFLTAVLFLIAILATGAFYFSLQIEQASIKDSIKTREVKYNIAEFDKYDLVIKRNGIIVNFLTNDTDNLHEVSKLIDRLNVDRPVGIKINTVEINKAGSVGWPISLRGTSANRQNIIDFANNLKNDALFSDINYPVSDLIKETGGEFSITGNVVLNKI